MIIHEVEAKLGVLETVRQPAEIDSILPGTARFAVLAATDGAQRRVVGDGTEAEVNLRASLGDDVICAEISAGRIDARPLPTE